MKLSQEDLSEKLIPIFKKKGKLFKKKTKVKARHAGEGEVVYTITSDGLETKNLANQGDMLIENHAQENYLVSQKKFEERYGKDVNIDNDWAWYIPKGSVIALKIDMELLDFLNQADKFYFMAPWGEKMIAKKSDYLVCPPDYSEVYRIAKKEFGETYKPVND